MFLCKDCIKMKEHCIPDTQGNCNRYRRIPNVCKECTRGPICFNCIPNEDESCKFQSVKIVNKNIDHRYSSINNNYHENQKHYDRYSEVCETGVWCPSESWGKTR